MVVVFSNLQGKRVATQVESIEEGEYKEETILKLHLFNGQTRYLRFYLGVNVDTLLDDLFHNLGEGEPAINTLKHAKEFDINKESCQEVLQRYKN